MAERENMSGPGRDGFKHISLNVALLAASVVLFSGALEVALRIIYAHSLDFSMEMWKYAVALKHPVF